MKNLGRFLGTLGLIVAAGLLLILAQLISSGPEGCFWLEQSALLRPIARVLSWADDSVASLTKAPQLARQNIALLEKNRTLENKLAAMQALEQENREMRDMLKLKSRFSKNSVAAEVISRDPQAWYAQVVVDKGSADGVTDSMVAVASGSLLGRVSEVGRHSSIIRLLTADRTAVPVKLSGSGATVVLYGVNGKNCRGRYFHRDTKAAPKTAVLTSGLGDIYPGGILVGRVGAQDAVCEDLFQELQIVPSVDLGSLRQVMLVQK